MLTLVLMTLTLLSSASASAQCERSSIVKFSVTSWRNETGHRLVEADVRTDVSPRDSVTLLVDLWTEKCDAVSAMVLSARASTQDSQVPIVGTTTVAAPRTEPVSSTATPTASPPPGYRLIPGHGHYKELPSEMSWLQGVTACKKEGARMLLLDSQEELDAVWKEYKPYSNGHIWVGVHRECTTAPWTNERGENWDSKFFGWWPDQPSGDGLCVALDCCWENPPGTFNTYCEDDMRVVCEHTP